MSDDKLHTQRKPFLKVFVLGLLANLLFAGVYFSLKTLWTQMKDRSLLKKLVFLALIILGMKAKPTMKR